MAYSKVRQHRGHSHIGGMKKKCRGAGNRGGRGNAGLHKYKITWTVKYDPYHFKKPSMKPKMNKPPVINLEDINNIILKENKKEFDYSDYKVLGNGSLSQPVKIKARSFSAGALEKISKAGGKAEALYPAEAETQQKDSKPQVKTNAAAPAGKIQAKPAKAPPAPKKKPAK